MAKFKKGDWVRRVTQSDAPRLFGEAGHVYKVLSSSAVGIVVIAGEPEADPSAFEPWTPKVGERVRYKNTNYGEATVIELVGDSHVKVDTHGRYRICTEKLSDLEPLPVAAEAQPAAQDVPAAHVAAPLTIQAGKFYKTRDGRKVGPMVLSDVVDCQSGKNGEKYTWSDIESGNTYTDGGRYAWDTTREHEDDLIAEWPADTTASDTTTNTAATVDALDEEYGPVVAVADVQVAKLKFKVGDRVVQDHSADCADLVGHWNDYWSREHGKVVDGKFVVVRVTDQWVQYSNKDGGDGPQVTEECLKLATSPAIVCLVENGQPLPATRPFVHSSVELADKEAARLASVHKGQEFGVFTLGEKHKAGKWWLAHEWQRLAACGEKIAAIKTLRNMAAIDLMTAKRAVEVFMEKSA